MARALAARLARSRAPLVDPGKQMTERFPGSSLRQRVAIGASRQREAIRHPDALWRKRGIELAQRSGLAADQGDVLKPDILEPTDVTIHRAFSWHCNAARLDVDWLTILWTLSPLGTW